MIERDLFVQATNTGVLHPGRIERFTAFASDSREVAHGDLFVAVRGMHADGHDFALEAVQNGAAGVVMEASHVQDGDPDLRARLIAEDAAIFVVADVRAALRDYAAAVLRAWRPRVIAVTGSMGKTTTKEAIATILSRHASTFRSWRNYNDLLGVPLSLGRLEPQHEFAVIEFGSDWPGEIAELAAMCRPEIAVILNTGGTDHDGTSDAHKRELGTLYDMFGPDHVLILNAANYAENSPLTPSDKRADYPRLIWFNASLSSSAEQATTSLAKLQPPYEPLVIVDEEQTTVLPPTDHLRLALRAPHEQAAQVHDFRGLHGEHWRHAVLAALTVTAHLGIDIHAAADTLADFTTLPGRMHLLAGTSDALLLDDSHNALPAATTAALVELHRLGKIYNRPCIAVLGDISPGTLPLERAQQLIGRQICDNADWLVTRGEISAGIARAASLPEQRVAVTYAPADTVRAVQAITAHLDTPPIILVKGAPAAHMETVTEQLLADPSQAPEVLDRQRFIWKRAIVGEPSRPTWLEIDLGAIGGNVRAIADLVGPHVAVMATLKADAYGHGAIKVAHTALRNGATWLGVATLSEAIPLHAAGIHTPILVFGYLPAWQARDALQHDVRVTVYELDTPRALSRAAAALSRTARLHVKVDTGMGRLGLRAEDPAAIVAFIRELHALPQIVVEGIYTHFATADERDQTYARRQLERFHAVLAALDAAGLRPPIVHAANSAATLALPESHFDLVRPGIALYGLQPSDDVPLPLGFRPGLSFKTQIAQVKEVPAGEGISYGITYITDAPERIATLPVGYADGFRRAPANWGEVLIRGRRAPIRGRVCMDQTMVSVQHIPDARAGDEVVLIGTQGNDRITAEEVAARLGTNNYEVVSALLARVPRITG